MAFDAFLKIDGIPGESTDDKHKDWIEITSYAFGVSQAHGGGGRSDAGAAFGGRADFNDLSIAKKLDKASPKLFLSCIKGDNIPSVVMELCRATGDKSKYLEVKLSDVHVASVQPSGVPQGSDAVPGESVNFNYGKIEYTYFATDHKTGKPSGQVAMNWSTTENKGG